MSKTLSDFKMEIFMIVKTKLVILISLKLNYQLLLSEES